MWSLLGHGRYYSFSQPCFVYGNEATGSRSEMNQDAHSGGTSGSVPAGDNIDLRFPAARQVGSDNETVDAGVPQSDGPFVLALLDNSPLSFDYLKRDVIARIGDIKKHQWKNPKMLELVKDYFEDSKGMIDFFAALKTSHKKALEFQLIVGEYVVAVAADEDYQPPEVMRMRFAKTLREFRQYFLVGCVGGFNAVYEQQSSRLTKFENRKVELEKKFESVKARRRVSRIIFVSAFGALLICDLVAAIKASHRTAGIVSAVTTIPLVSLGQWFDSKWKNCEVFLEDEKKLINILFDGTSIVRTHLYSITSLMKRLEDKTKSLLDYVGFVFKSKDDMNLSIEGIKEYMVIIMKDFEDLVSQADQCSGDIRTAWTRVVHRIIKQPKG